MSNIHVSAQPYMDNTVYLTIEAIASLKNTHLVHLSLENCQQLTQYSETVSEILLTLKYVRGGMYSKISVSLSRTSSNQSELLYLLINIAL